MKTRLLHLHGGRCGPLCRHRGTQLPFIAAITAIVTALLLSCSAWALELEACRITANEGRAEVQANCGTLAVPLDPSAPEGERIELFVAVVKALSEDPAPDPFVFIAGGPGAAATRSFAGHQAAFERIARQRDVLLVDQRGTGRSAPLHCNHLAELGFARVAGMNTANFVRSMLDCAKTFDHDPRFFTTSLAVQDLDRVREALGYQRLNLYGISYGTRVAQHYLRRFPRHVHSVVLDGVVPSTVSISPNIALNSQAALEALFNRCRENAACHEAYPNLAAHFNAVYRRLRSKPIEVAFDDPRSGESTTVPLNHMVMAEVIKLLLYSPYGASLLPSLVETAYRGDYRELAVRSHVLTAAWGKLALGLNYAVRCAEEVPFWGNVDMNAQARTYLGSRLVEGGQRVCASWPRGVVDDDFRQPVASDVPVLLVSGELDPATPPHYATLAAERLSNALTLVGPGQGHGMFMVPCVQRLMADFVDGANLESLDLRCLDRIRQYPPFVSPMGSGS